LQSDYEIHGFAINQKFVAQNLLGDGQAIPMRIKLRI
jgi:hypothetical protein